MNPQLRQALIFFAAAVLAVWMGIELADGGLFWPVLAAVVAVGAILSRVLGLSADVIIAGFVLVGYLVGNRGFAQVTPVPGLPLFPAEVVLFTAVAWRTILCAIERRIPFRNDALNWAVLAWLVIGTARVVFDVPRFGLTALRDYATVYYAALFFVAQDMGQEAKTRQFFRRCLLAGLILLPPVYLLHQLFPATFLRDITVKGNPLIYFKGDLVHTFLATCSVLVFFWARGSHRYWAWPLSTGLFLYVCSGDSRASALGLILVCTALLAAKRWLFPAWQLSALLLAGTLVLILATVAGNDWAERKIHGAGDRVRSVLDITGTRTYQSEESYYKGDNNRFRLIWWRSVATETFEQNPIFGLGFGYDLARGFVQEYSPELIEEFTARSPHNIFVTALGRMGLVGLAAALVLAVNVALGAWHHFRDSADLFQIACWAIICQIAISATFGVVLEGPMGAVPFWILLGLAHARSTETAAAPTASLRAEPAAV